MEPSTLFYCTEYLLGVDDVLPASTLFWCISPVYSALGVDGVLQTHPWSAHESILSIKNPNNSLRKCLQGKVLSTTLLPEAPKWWLIPAYDSSIRRFNSLLWPPPALHTRGADICI